ncbi:MAG TPA: AAA family ATPase [Sedimentisphaerales bacterium]|nr:AAA family ATPase [Sedimentisphaerales bacterium]
MRTIAILNQKGGVGKTTTVVNTAAALAAMGSRVLAIDLDPQAHLTIHLGLEPQTIEAGSYKVLTQSAAVGNEIMLTRLNLWILPANIDLVGAETELVSVVGREIILREALEEVADKFDFCLIDCPPSLGLLTLNALAAAQEVLIPLQPHFLGLQGFGKLLQTIELVNRRINPQLKVDGVLLCMFDTRASLPSEVRADIERFLTNARGTNCAWANARILPTFIRRNIKLAEAPSYGKTIFEYEPDCHGAEDYRKVAEFIRSRLQPQPQPPIKITPVAGDGSQAAPQLKPRLSSTYEYRAAAPSQNGPVAPRNIQTPVPPRVRPGGSVTAPQSPIQAGPTAPRNLQVPLRPNPQPANSDDARRNAPIEIRQIGRSSPQTPQQPGPNPPDPRSAQSPLPARITQIKPPNPPKSNQDPAPANPTEPPQN